MTIKAKRMWCPNCGIFHVDVGEWATRPHHWHVCHFCLFEWKLGEGEEYFAGTYYSPDERKTAECFQRGIDYATKWFPIEQYTQEIGIVEFYAKELIDEDFNPLGIVTGAFTGDYFEAAVWCGIHDCFETRKINPTHFRPQMAPPKEEIKEDLFG